VTESVKTSLIAHDSKFDLSSYVNTKLHEYTIKFHCQNHPVLSGLLLLAAFSKLSGEPYE